MGTKLQSLFILGSLGALLASGCASSSTRTGTVPDSAWDSTSGSPRTSSPSTRARTLRSERPLPGNGAPLTREQVLQLANAKDSQDAIAEIDRHPLTFPLDSSNIAWFEDRLVPPEVADYLKKRAQVDWSQMRSDSPTFAQDPSAVPAPPPANDAWGDAPDAAPPAPVVVNDSPTVVYESSSPTIIVGGSWYDGYYWRPWRPWYHNSGYVGAGVVYSSGYGGIYYSHNGAYANPGYAPAANYGRYPYTQGSFVYQQPRGFTQPRAISRPSAPTSHGSSRGSSGRGSGGHHR